MAYNSNVTLYDAAGNIIVSATTTPAGTERALITRPILSPLPTGTNTLGNVNTQDPDIVATGTISATDAVVVAPAGAGAFVSGASTAGSTVFVLAPGGDSAWNVQITGLTSGTLYFEGSADSTTGGDGNWIAVNGRMTGVVNTVLGYSATANGYYRGNTSGLKYFRVRSVGALTGTPAIIIRLAGGVGAVFLNASIPAGTNSIGFIAITDGSSNPIPSATAALAGTERGLIVRNIPSGTQATSLATLPSLVAGAASIGTVGLNAGANAIGSVTVTGTPAITGSGSVATPATGVLTVQGISGGAAQPVSIAALPSLVAGSATIGNVGLVAGAASIGTVGLNAGTNTIGAVLPLDSTKTTYSATVTSAMTASGVVFAITGSATKTVRVLRISISGTLTTGAVVGVTLVKYSAAATGGTLVATSSAPHDSANAAATATTTGYSAAPATSGIIGSIRTDKLWMPATTAQPQLLEWLFGNRPGQAVVLRGTAQQLGVNIPVTTGPSWAISCEWTEE